VEGDITMKNLKLRVEYTLTLNDESMRYNIVDIPHGFMLTNETGKLLCKLENKKIYLGFPCWMTVESFAVNGFLLALDIPTTLASKGEFRSHKAYYDMTTKKICNIADNRPIEKLTVRCQRFFDGHTETRKGLK
jgi:hypothetical protein